MRHPIRVFVPMDTLRDFLFVDDAASMALGLLTVAVARQPADPQVRVLAAGQATSVAELVALVQRVSRTRIGVVQAPTPANAQHVIDLRLRTRHPGPPGVTPRTLLATGVRRVYDDILRQTASGALAERHGQG
jgi:UDP-glucose 4-epimerase